MTIIVLLTIATVAQAFGLYLALRIVRVNAEPRLSQAPTLPAPPPVPREFTAAEWKTVP